MRNPFARVAQGRGWRLREKRQWGRSRPIICEYRCYGAGTVAGKLCDQALVFPLAFTVWMA